MKVSFFEPYTLALPHFETALELMQIHLNEGDDVSLYYCSADLNFCEANPNHHLPKCFDCISRRKNGIELIDGHEKIQQYNFVNLSTAEKKIINSWNTRFRDIHELKAFRYEDIDMGMAVASSLISFYRNPEPAMESSVQLVNRLFKASLKVYFSFKRHLQNSKPDLVYLFNGRFSNIRPVVRLCELYKIPYRIHERGADKGKYSVFENHLPHDFLKFQQLIEKQWEKAPQHERDGIADAFYKGRKAGKEQSWFSFVSSQKQDQLPDNWDPSLRNIVIFNSSEDEFAAIGDSLKRTLFPTQLGGIRYIANSLKDNKSIAVYIRIHPNLKNIHNASVSEIYNIHAPNFHVIEPSSSISSYKLIDSCDTVVTFGSTVGIEATYWDKPSILLGESFYNGMNAVYIPQSVEELNALLLHETKPKDKLGACKYGYYIATYGIDFTFYKPEELFEGKFKNVRIRSGSRFKRILSNKYLQPVIGYLSKKHAGR